ncbi:MAG: hypothetical protein KF678_12045 [Phycisphaeraceae bacterium]|nr:hypothetical protein [Phycisphaeraceae bacterium]
MKALSAVIAATALTVFVSAGHAQQRTLQFDVNNLAFQAFNAGGQASAFGGLTHTGRLDFFEDSILSELLSVSIRVGANPFQVQPSYSGTLTDFAMTINLVNGAVTGGNLSFDVNGGPGIGGDRYSASFSAAGVVSNYIGGGFKVEGLSFAGTFSDGDFAGVPIADFFAAQGGAFLPGDFIAFKIQPNASGAGFADTDIFVTNVPTPGAVLCAGLGGLLCLSRRRR